MRQSNLKPFVILALNTGNTGAVEEAIIRAVVPGCRVVSCSGVYKGVPELSWLVMLESNDNYMALLDLAYEYSQERILSVDNERQAELKLLLPNGQDSEALGKFKHVCSTQALASGNYTELNGNYYITDKDITL